MFSFIRSSKIITNQFEEKNTSVRKETSIFPRRKKSEKNRKNTHKKKKKNPTGLIFVSRNFEIFRVD